MRIEHTGHSRMRQKSRNIPDDLIKLTVILPTYSITRGEKTESIKDINGKFLKVVYVRKKNFILIVTAYYIQ